MAELQTLREMIERRGVSQRELAELLNMSESSVSLKVAGKRKMSLHEAAIIARRLNITSDQVEQALNFEKN